MILVFLPFILWYLYCVVMALVSASTYLTLSTLPVSTKAKS